MPQDDRLNRLTMFQRHFMGRLQLIRHIRFILAGRGGLELIQMFHQRSQLRIDPVLNNRHLLFNLLFLKLPAHPNNDRTFINGSTHVLVNECRLVDLGIELVVQHHLVLDCCIPIFPGNRTDVEHIIRTQERLTQGRVTPFSLLTNQLWNDPGIALWGIDLGTVPDKQIIQPQTDLGFLCIKGRRGVLIIPL